MLDALGRKIEYLRISVTDRCNLRCVYCMPGDIDLMPMNELLTFEEIARVAEAFSELGIRHLRLTGGEPLVRRHCEDLAAMLTGICGIETVGMTTNGVLLSEKAAALRKAGVAGVNISLDTLDPEKFRQTTGLDVLDSVLKGIEAAMAEGLAVKLNAVARDCTDEVSLTEYASGKGVPIRFIELMPIGKAKSTVGKSNLELMRNLANRYGTPKRCGKQGAGPAVYYRYPGLSQPVGFISALHGKFCADCNRVRLTSDGFLKLCLCYSDGISLKEPLRNGCTDAELIQLISEAVRRKPAAHRFDDITMITEDQSMNRIGG